MLQSYSHPFALAHCNISRRPYLTINHDGPPPGGCLSHCKRCLSHCKRCLSHCKRCLYMSRCVFWPHRGDHERCMGADEGQHYKEKIPVRKPLGPFAPGLTPLHIILCTLRTARCAALAQSYMRRGTGRAQPEAQQRTYCTGTGPRHGARRLERHPRLHH